jgi:hypothetical protein
LVAQLARRRGLVAFSAVAVVLLVVAPFVVARGVPRFPTRDRVEDSARRAWRSRAVWQVRALDLKTAALGRFRSTMEPVAA